MKKNRKKRFFSDKEKEEIIDLCVRGYSRTYIAKYLRTRNSILENFCEENNIPLNKKGIHYISERLSGNLVTRFGILRFDNSYELYYILHWENNKDVIDIVKSPKAINYNNEIMRPNFSLNLHIDNKNVIQLIELSKKFIDRPLLYDGNYYIVLYVNEKTYPTLDTIKSLIKQDRVQFDNIYFNKKFRG